MEALDFLNKNKDALAILGGSIAALVTAGWAYFKHRRETAKPKEPTKAAAGAGVHIGGGIQTGVGNITIAGGDIYLHQESLPEAIVDKLLELHARNQDLNRQIGESSRQLEESEGQKKALVAAVSDLQKRQLSVTSPSSIDAALQALELGNTDAAERLFLREAERGDETAGRAYRHLGALAFLHDTRKALDAYRKATDRDPRDPEGWNQLGHLFDRVGELEQARRAYETVLELAGSDKRWRAIAYGNLGNVYVTHGDLHRAVEFYQKALAIDTELGSQQGMASAYGNLGNVYKTRGDLDRAVEFYEKALAIEIESGRKKGIASDYLNLGNVHKTRGDLDRAVDFCEKALAIFTELGSKEGMAGAYGNLGNVYKTRGDLDCAVNLYEKALAIFTSLESKEGMASAYGNLGNVYQTRGDLDRTIVFYGKALAIETALGRKEGMAIAYGNLGLVYQICGDLDLAVDFYEKSLVINTELGRKQGMAIAYGNLGLVYQIRGDLDLAVEVCEKSLTINAELGRNEGMASDYCDLGLVYQTRGDLDRAATYFAQSLNLFQSIGAAIQVEQVKRLIAALRLPPS